MLSHTTPNGRERPVAYALSAAECNYTQIYKKALAVVWGVKTFHQYMYMHGLNFTSITDNLQLTALFSPDSKCISNCHFMAAETGTLPGGAVEGVCVCVWVGGGGMIKHSEKRLNQCFLLHVHKELTETLNVVDTVREFIATND